jgi:pyruvate dehydrogenase E1 component
MLHPTEKPRQSFVEQVLAGHDGPYIAASDYVRAVPEQIAPWIPGDYLVLGTDGMGRSETREALRRHFEVDAESIVVAALYQLQKQAKVEAKVVAQAINDLGVDPEKVNPLNA